MNGFYFLTRDQVKDDSPKRLTILEKFGLKCEISGFSILLGGNYYKDDDGKLYAPWWLGESTGDGGQRIVTSSGRLSETLKTMRYIGARPALPADLVLKKGINCGINNQGILEYKYLDYPKTIVENRLYELELEGAYKKQHPTGKKYVTDSADFHEEYDEWYGFRGDVDFSYGDIIDTTLGFTPREHIEYEYKENKYFPGNKYIRFVADENCAGKILPDGRKCVLGKPYWVLVEPIIWLIDKEANVALAKQIVFAGVHFARYYTTPEDWFIKYWEYSPQEITIFDFMKENLECFLDLSNEDTKDQITESLPLSDDTKALLDKVDELIKTLSPKDRQVMLERRNALVQKYQTDLAKRQEMDFELFSKPVNLTLEENLNPEVSLHTSLYDLAFMLTRQESLVKRIKQIDSYLELFQSEITELPKEKITKEDMIKTVVFYANKYDKYLGKKLKDKLEETLASYKEQCKLELESFSLEEASKPTLEHAYFDKDLELLGKIMNVLDRAVSYNENLGVYVEFIDKLESAILDPTPHQEDKESMASIIIEARGVIDSLEEKRKETLERELQEIVENRIARVNEMLNSSEILDSSDMKEIEREFAEELQPFLVKLDNEANRSIALKNITDQVANSRRILEEKEREDNKPLGIIDSFVTDIHNALLSGEFLGSDREKAQKMVTDSLNKFSVSLEGMTKDQIKAINNLSYIRDGNHPLSILQSSLAELSLLISHYHNQNNPIDQQTGRRR